METLANDIALSSSMKHSAKYIFELQMLYLFI